MAKNSINGSNPDKTLLKHSIFESLSIVGLILALVYVMGWGFASKYFDHFGCTCQDLI
ncbi:MAG: hypothetical protein HQL52_19370 [Magnetococcales bacterium]|nr:hypothetical protein [Magnetococcales bacterium]